MEPRKLNERSPNRSSGGAVARQQRPVMVRVDYQDEDGRWWAALVPVGHEDEAHMGIPIGPPDLSPLDLPKELEVRLHNQLFNRGLLTARDVKGHAPQVFAALQATYRVDVAAVTGLYR